MASTPTPENIRLTISVTPEVHSAFSRMAEVSGMSLGRCMGEWMADTLEGVQFVTTQLQRAREAPREVVKEMRQTLLGAQDEMDQLLTDLRSGKVVPKPLKMAEGARARARTASAAPVPTSPRPVIRGGKSNVSKTKGVK